MKWNSKYKTRFEGKVTIVVILLILISISLSAFANGTKLDPDPIALEIDESDTEYEKIDPIIVEGDDGFSEEYWKGNGTEDDPYKLKEAYEIDASGNEYGIKIDSVSDSHFIIENVEIYGASGDIGAGIHIYYSENGEIKDNNLHNNDIGIYATDMTSDMNNIFKGNEITDNQYGIEFNDVSNQVIKDNKVLDNSEVGVYLTHFSFENDITGNTISNNLGHGIKTEEFCPYNLMEGNTILGNEGSGIYLLDNSDEVELTNNLIENNAVGIEIEDSDGNEIWKNQFIGNTEHAIANDENKWNSGDPAEGDEGGNYWSDHNLEDRHDNIGKDPYDIDGEDNKDNYPWLTPDMSRHPIDRYELSVDNITAGSSPSINLSEAYNVEDYSLEGMYRFEIVIGNETDFGNFTFQSGDATLMGENITESGEYKMNITGDEITESDTFYVEAGKAHSVNITTNNETTLLAGENLEFNAEVLDRYGNFISDDGEHFTWDNATNGTFNRTKTGHYNVTATFEEEIVSKPINVTVIAAEVDSVVLKTPSKTNITAGEKLEFTAKAYDEYKNLITNDTEDFDWENASSTGTFNKTIACEYEVKATYKANETFITDPINITVEPSNVHSVELKEPSKNNITAGDEKEFNATAYDRYNNTITDDSKDFGWENASDGIFNKTTAGKYQIRATFDGKLISNPINLTVEPAEAISVKLYEPQKTNITAGETLKLKAEASDRFGNLVTNNSKDFHWENITNGTFNKTKVGEYEIRVTYKGNENLTSEPINLTVKIGQIHSVELIEPSETTITAGQTLEFHAKAYDEYNNLIADENQDFKWNTASNGTFEETTAGVHRVSATYHDEKDKVSSESCTIVVRPASLNDFDVLVDDTTAGSSPEIEIVRMKDRYGNWLRGEYKVEMTIKETTRTVNLTFTAGSTVYEWDNITLVDQYSIDVNIQEISKSEKFQVNPGPPDSIEIEPSEKVVSSVDNVIYKSIAYDEWDNEIEEVTEETDWHIHDYAGGTWNDNEYKPENHGTWDITATYTYDDKNLTDNSTLIVKAEVEVFEYKGLNTIIFEENLDYELEWYVNENNTISYYEILAGNSSEELETIETKLKNESYNYQFQDEETVHFKIIGYQENGQELESINFTVKVDLIQFEIEERENKIFTVDIPEERKNEVNVTWFIEDEVKGVGEVFIPELEPGEYNITGEVSNQDHEIEKTFEIIIDESDEEERSMIYIYGVIAILIIIIGVIIIYIKSKTDSDEKETFVFSEKDDGSEKDTKEEKSSTDTDKKPSPGISARSGGSTSTSGLVDKELLVQIFEDIEKATKKQVYAEFTGKSSENITVEKLEEKIQSLVQDERLTMQPRKDADTIYIWNEVKQGYKS